MDLSFRHSFKDEPAAKDLPSRDVLRQIRARENASEAAVMFRDILRRILARENAPEVARLRQEAVDMLKHADDLEADGTSIWERYLG